MQHKYLINNRLSDIITLIQILSLANDDFVTEEQIINRTNKKPKSTVSWSNIAIDHPEFFLISELKIYLNYRYYDRRKMSVEETMSLVNNANSIHDKELSQRNKNSFLIPLYIAIFSTAVSIFSLFYNVGKIEKSIKQAVKSEVQKMQDSIAHVILKSKLNND